MTRQRQTRAGARKQARYAEEFVESLLGESEHAKRVSSISDGVVGVLHASSLGVAAIGQGLAIAHGLSTKHAVKQIDRLLSNTKFEGERFFDAWVSYILSEREDVVVILDWTDFDDADQTTLMLSCMTEHGRSTPLMWKTVRKSELGGQRNNHEDELMESFAERVSEGVHVTVIADRGFSDTKFYHELKDVLGFDYIIRFKCNILVDYKGRAKAAKDWLHESGRAKTYKDVLVTEDEYPVPVFVSVHDKDMDDPWFLVSSRSDLTGRAIIKLYGKRFTCEETFRDLKNVRFGLRLSTIKVKRCDRRDRLIILATLAHALLTLLGQAGEDIGVDRHLKTNTSSRRQHSLFRQGVMWYQLIPNMPSERLAPLMRRFNQLILEHSIFSSLFASL